MRNKMNKSQLICALGLALALPAFILPVFNYKFDKRQLESFTPPHKKNRRGKFKRSGR